MNVYDILWVKYYSNTFFISGNARETGITKLVNQHVPKAERARRHGRELSYILPHDAVDFFAPLFLDIEHEIKTKVNRLGICSYGVSMTTLEEVFLHLETENNEEETTGNVENLSKKMVRNRALSRSLSLQGRSNSYQSLENDANCVADNDNNKGTIRSLPEIKTTNHIGFPTIISSETGVIEPIISRKSSITRQQMTANWMELNDIVLEPSSFKSMGALLKLRITILMRDLQRLYLMIFLPLIFTAGGLYLNSIQVINPITNSIKLDNTTYPTRIAVHDFTDNNSSEFETFVGELGRMAEVSFHLIFLGKNDINLVGFDVMNY